MPSEKLYLTRGELAQYLTANGYPISKSTLDKLCAPARKEGPAPAKRWLGRPEVAEACGVSPIVIFRTCAKHGVPVTRFNRHRAGLTMQNYAELLKRTSQPAKVLA